jgi:hypothetical protein
MTPMSFHFPLKMSAYYSSGSTGEQQSKTAGPQASSTCTTYITVSRTTGWTQNPEFPAQRDKMQCFGKFSKVPS